MRRYLGLIIIGLFLASCGSAEESSQFQDSKFNGDNLPQDLPQFDVFGDNPFNGALTGDHFEWGFFIREEYRTTSITSLPIPIYLAYFTIDEEEEVLEGINLANEAAGFELFRVTDTWQNDARPIYKVEKIEFDAEELPDGQANLGSAVGYTYTRSLYYNNNPFSERVVTDFSIEIEEGFVTRYTVAHELGHGAGIEFHKMIDYENNRLIDLEVNSLMGPTLVLNPAFNDYFEMMETQGQILIEKMNL